MASILIDSDMLIDYLRGEPNIVALLQQLEAFGDRLCTCDIVITEVESGLNPTQSSAARVLMSSLVVLERNVAASRQAGRWRYDYARRGITLSTPDALIAATAFSHGAGILTRNVSHFPMPELTVLRGPTRPPRR
jgi:predicted nucleic acid-binding protein